LPTLPPLGYRADWSENVGRNICQATGFFFEDRMGIDGKGVLMPPLVVLQQLWLYELHEASEDEAKSNKLKKKLQWVAETLAMVQENAARVTEVV
jgi:hypothetical protein